MNAGFHNGEINLHGKVVHCQVWTQEEPREELAIVVKDGEQFRLIVPGQKDEVFARRREARLAAMRISESEI